MQIKLKLKKKKSIIRSFLPFKSQPPQAHNPKFTGCSRDINEAVIFKNCGLWLRMQLSTCLPCPEPGVPASIGHKLDMVLHAPAKPAFRKKRMED